MKNREDWDDGRTVADMSEVTRPRLFSGGKPKKEEKKAERIMVEYTPSERRWAVLGALRAALLIALVYLAGLALVIALLIRLWK